MLSVGLAADAFAVSVCKGLALEKPRLKNLIEAGLWFGAFQTIMPLGGFYLSALFSRYVLKYGPLISFIILAIIGFGMIKEALAKEESEKKVASAKMFPLALATSIDAFAAGAPIALNKGNLILTILYIGVVTFVLSALGVLVGSLFGSHYHKKATFFGGTVLVLLAFKFLFICK